MIITIQKPFDKILEMTKGFNKLFLIGCEICATECQTGGETEVKAMIEKLKEAGKTVTGYTVIESVCDERRTRLELKKNEEAIAKADALLIMSCGTAVQVATDLSKKMCIPGCDTEFIGMIERIGRFYERCRACGDCILFETGGICPIARCGKGMLNGPCGGQSKGKCEVGGWKKDCAWVLIYNRLKELDKLDEFRRYRPPKDYSLIASAREVVYR